ncbi:MAG: 1-acyl-sn-glycerol-3-phosphate acyltransferase [Gammaproteobacteria bacterium]|nr:1-acyl-sn-glycerol-3-phosphate acyltransferase [Gammaproteobacteria bacterium]
MKKNRKEKRLVKKPNFFIWYLLGPIVILAYRMMVKFRRNKIKIRKKSLILAPHRNYLDFISIPLAVYPVRGHFVATSYWYRMKKLAVLLRILGCIKKDQYKSDINAIKEMSSCFKFGDVVYMCPEGQMSPDGKSQILVPGIERLIKKFKVNVYFVNINGAYFTGPKWHFKNIRGNLDAETSLIIKEEDIDNLSTDEIMNILNENFKKNNDFVWIKDHPNYKYKSRKKAEGLEKVIFRCPNCQKEGTMKSTKSTIFCDCGFSLTFNKNNYNFLENDRFNGLEDLLTYESNIVLDDIKNDLIYQSKCDIKSFSLDLNPVQESYDVVKMSNDALTFIDSKTNEQVSFDLAKVINFVITLKVSFEIPTPEKTYRIYIKDGDDPYKYWLRMRYIKEKK